MDDLGISRCGWRLYVTLAACAAGWITSAPALGQSGPEGATDDGGGAAADSQLGEWGGTTTPGVGGGETGSDEALDLTERRCWEGWTDACAGLGDRFLWGRGVVADPAVASLYYARACWLLGVDARRGEEHSAEAKVDADSIGSLTGAGRWACHQLALMYDTGWGVPRDLQLAVVHARRACEAGLTLACDLLDGLYEQSQ
jgi:TPR repeat protein